MVGTDGSIGDERQQLWHGRFESGPAAELVEFTESLSYDQRLIFDDIRCSKAHVRGLHRGGLLNDDELDVKKALRSGGSEQDVARILSLAVLGKPTGHRLDEGLSTEQRSMFQIGG